jgi:hypothetical protein
MHSKRLAHYFAFLAGENVDWIGKPLDEAHSCKFISE